MGAARRVLSSLMTTLGLLAGVGSLGCEGSAELVGTGGSSAGVGGAGASGTSTVAETTATSTSSGGLECQTAADCPPVEGPCQEAECAGGACAVKSAPAGLIVADPIPDDCLTDACDGAGNVVVVADDSDAPESLEDCAPVHCAEGALTVELLTGAPCAQDGGAICDTGVCVECLTDQECASQVCLGGTCVDATCLDGVKNGSETDVDCGGPSCLGCAAGLDCQVGSDCLSSVCTLGVCQAPTCNDGVTNGAETDVDCGGPTCVGCDFLEHCLQDTDCLLGSCAGNLCQGPSCANGVKDGNETGVDCGGGACQACAEGVPCVVGQDCVDGLCIAGLCDAPPSCQGGGVGADAHCGAADVHCCDRPSAPGGTYDRFNDPSLPATMTGPIQVETFLVTVGRFRKFVAAGQGTSQSPPTNGAGAYPGYPNSGWLAAYTSQLPADTAALKAQVSNSALCVKDAANQPYATWTDQPGANEKKPIVCVSWYVAYAFCIWDGGRLPTENELDYVWTGGSQQRPRPWGSAPTSASYAAYDCTADGSASGVCAKADIVDVGSYLPGVGLWGHYDLLGDAASWMRDAWSGPDAMHPANPILPVGCAGDCLNLVAQNAGVDTVVYRGGGAIADWQAPVQTDFDPYVDRRQNLRYEANMWRGVRCAR